MGLNVRHCKKCHRVFQYTNNPYCQDCLNELDKKFNMIRDYIYTHPNATIDNICKDVEIDRTSVLGWLREGRLILSSASTSLLSCTICGTPISTGKYCPVCITNMKNQLKDSAKTISQSINLSQSEKPKRKTARMHIDPHNKK